MAAKTQGAARTPIAGAAQGRPLLFHLPDVRRVTAAPAPDETAGFSAYAALYEDVLRVERAAVIGK